MDPKPGWVRSSDVPSWQLVTRLNERIAQLENGKSSQIGSDKSVKDKELFEFAATVTWSETDSSAVANGKKEYFGKEFAFKMAWDDLFLCFPLKAGKETTEVGLKKRFQNELAKQYLKSIESQSGQSLVDNVATKLQAKDFDNIFQHFVARGYFVSTTKNNGPYFNRAGRKKTLWKLTQSGIRKYAACKTERLGKT